jgi:phosphomannomutase
MVRKDGGRVVAVGYDGRLSSPDLEAALVEGLVETGIDVDRIGRGPTPMLYFAIKHLKTAAGVMITGSHNPPEYNGIKMATAKGPVYGEQIQEIGRIAAAGNYAEGRGAARRTPIETAYVDRLVEDYDGTRELKVAWDAGNGAGGDILKALTKRLPGRHTLLYAEIDGRFPNHHPDPTIPENLKALQKAVAEGGCDLGIAFDGDADRIGAVDEKGRIVWGDQLVAIYAGDVLKTHPGATIIADVKASQTLYDEIARLGGKPLMWKTGHSLLKAKMAETGSPLAGEMSGHIFFADRYYGFDDALYCGVRLVGLVSKSGELLSALRDRLPHVVNTPEVRFQVDEARKFAVVREIQERLKTAGADVNDIDGVRVRTRDGWWLLRASNTQDVLVARAESTTDAGLERLKAQIVDQLERSGLPRPSFTSSAH